ncbi:hypothetical protein [Syntrophorhabdus aromaticivorans]|uniref:hypothetical protein n=1 Tax=Syntrophorhabdus aromaticivorans TaxID=328301 RepID=UPI00041CAA59|nr:hypothetical protein [Syntrophorhabdus aromaticivorans]
MNDLEKARRLIGHWIGHGREHAALYEEWAEKIQALDGGAEMALALKSAAAKAYESVSFLEAAPQGGEEIHDHGHYHD